MHNSCLGAFVEINHHPRDHRARQCDEKRTDFLHNHHDLAVIIVVINEQSQNVHVAVGNSFNAPVVQGGENFKGEFEDPGQSLDH